MTTLENFVDLPSEEKLARGLLFTPREIAQQPDTWQATLHLFLEHQARIRAFLEQIGLLDTLEQRPVVMLVGAGTSDYIGHALSLLMRQTWGCEVSAYASTDLLPNLEDYIVAGRRYLWISFSRSGDSPEGVALLERAIQLYPKIAHLIVTCNAQARMIVVCEGAASSCVVVLNDEVNDRSLAMTSSFTNMVLMGQCLAHAWSIEEYSATVDRLILAGREFLITAAAEADKAALQGFTRVCLVGTGPLNSVAKESALKILEMTAGRVKTMSESVLGLRHGPMAALDSETLFICFASQDGRRAHYAKDLLSEIGNKAITAKRIAVGPESGRSELESCCESYLAIHSDIADEYRPVLDVIFGQLLGLYCSLAHQLKPDSPSPGGVINRVVQNFQIY